MTTKRYKNGNMTFRFEADELTNDKDLFSTFVSSVCDLDCQIWGDEFCISNYEMGMCFYSYYTDMKYIVPFGLFEELKNGKMIILLGENLDEYDRESLKEQEWYSE